MSSIDVKKVLMERDHMTEQEASFHKGYVADLIDECISGGGSYDDVEDIMAGELGLEMDYIFDMLI